MGLAAMESLESLESLESELTDDSGALDGVPGGD